MPESPAPAAGVGIVPSRKAGGANSDCGRTHLFKRRRAATTSWPRARVYFTEGKASAVIATHIGKDAGAPAPAKVLGSEIEAKPDGSMYRMTPYPQAGYWVAYSRTAGDSPMVMITMQKTP